MKTNYSAVSFFKRRRLNIDISHRCPLECPNCQRQRHYGIKGKKVPGYDISMEEFYKLTKFFKSINFCGQLSDPVHHPKFIQFLEYCYKNKIEAIIHNASSLKPHHWYMKAFKANPEAKWVFGIDGLPEQSHIYRINQDGKKLFNLMIESKKYLKQLPVWQYLVFKYNEDNILKAQEIAKKEGVTFMLLQSSRWNSENDPLRPSKKYNMSKK
tara:strand:- start:643 stop:1278 length:636 start_codon:yes stop_codon:yes gene_type:complete